MFLTAQTFWREAAGRAVKTFAQALLGLITADAADIFHASWVRLVGIAAGVAVLSVGNSILTGTKTKAVGEAKAGSGRAGPGPRPGRRVRARQG